MLAARVGLADTLCQYHVQRKARHGSAWAPTIRAGDLKPYLNAARAVLRKHRKDPLTTQAVAALGALLDGAGRVEPAMDIKHRPAAFRTRVAFARAREAGVRPDRLLVIHMAVNALIEDDLGSHRVEEYRVVQVAKAAHRLASGTHRQWEWPMPDGTTRPLRMHVYPKSSGRVLRVMGREIDELCAGVTARDLQAVRDLKLATSGPHPSRMPGWTPPWLRQRQAAAE